MVSLCLASLLMQVRRVKPDLKKPMKLELQNGFIFHMLQQCKELYLPNKQATGKHWNGKITEIKTPAPQVHTLNNAVLASYATQDVWIHLFSQAMLKSLCSSKILPVSLAKFSQQTLRQETDIPSAIKKTNILHQFLSIRAEKKRSPCSCKARLRPMPIASHNKHAKLSHTTAAWAMLFTHAEPRVSARQYYCHFSL